MAFIRLCDSYIDHPKFLSLSAFAFRLWHEGMAFCRKHQTDGLIPMTALQGFRYYKTAHAKELATPFQPDAFPLWETVEGYGYRVHDYLFWNQSKEEENAQKMLNGHRSAFYRDKGLRQKLRERDGDNCRYCGVGVNWSDRKGGKGATYDHVNPRGAATIENLVIACRSCNSRKGGLTPQEAGMVLIPPLDKSRYDLGRISDSTGSDQIRSDQDLKKKKREELPIHARSGRPIFNGQRLVIFEWQLDDLTKMLGIHTEAFDLHEWFFTADKKAEEGGIVKKARDWWPWLQAETLAEAQRRGLPVEAALMHPDDAMWDAIGRAGPSVRP